MKLSKYPRHIVRFIIEYGPLLVVLIIGVFVYQAVFSEALEQYLDSSLWIFRGVWLGEGETNLFGFTVSYQFEGYTDYSFYYVHWGHNMLDGVMPYTPEFGYREIGWYVNENGLYIFPPLTAIFYALGTMIPVDNWGIGLLLAIFSYLTVFPVYGLGRELSNNRHVGEVAALTYLLSPSVLYHSVFLWMNPAPFVFFFFMGFYMLARGNRLAGTLLIVTSALFKQTAWFLGFPLIVFLLMRGSPNEYEIEKDEKEQLGIFSRIIAEINSVVDLRGFLKYTLLVVIFAGVIVYPFLISQPYMFDYMRLAMGGFPLEPPFTDLPGYGTPIILPHLAVVADLPGLAEILNEVVRYGFLLYFGVILIAGLMFLEPRDNSKPKVYLRRLLFMSLMLMLWVYLTGPRGVFKYYFILMAPFFSIFSSTKMVSSKEEDISLSVSMIFLPIILSLMILIPPREVYLFAVILITVGYILASKVGVFWSLVSAPFGWLTQQIRVRIEPSLIRVKNVKERIEYLIYPERFVKS